jgi:hypothetical protein
VLVGAGEEEHILAVEPLKPRQRIGRDRLIGVADMRNAVRDRRSAVVMKIGVASAAAAGWAASRLRALGWLQRVLLTWDCGTAGRFCDATARGVLSLFLVFFADFCFASFWMLSSQFLGAFFATFWQSSSRLAAFFTALACPPFLAAALLRRGLLPAGRAPI